VLLDPGPIAYGRGTMAAPTAAGLLLFRVRDGRLEVLIGHMGGPFWARKEDHAWSIFKGGYDPSEEEPLAAARREFTEETGLPVPDGELIPLGAVRQSSGKQVIAWAVRGDADPATVVSNTYLAEWPPRSGKQQEFPEIDRVAWCEPGLARTRLVRAQVTFVERLQERLDGELSG
jgi:predicted NUDIX family NTP pyrophosphohydrolase